MPISTLVRHGFKKHKKQARLNFSRKRFQRMNARSKDLGRAGEESLGEGWEVLGGRCGHGSGLGDSAELE